MNDVLTIVLGGGRGTRLFPLTHHRSKPAVPIGGKWRLIDIPISNCLHAGLERIYVLTQYMSSSLIKHLSRNWRLSGFGEYIEVVPAQMRLGEFWYRGTADAVYQNLNLVKDARADHVAIFGGDHIYKFAVDQMEEQHRANNADLTVAAFPVPTAEASAFGIIDVDDAGRITSFKETDDGRYLITLTGICRFRVAEEFGTKTPFRQIRPDYSAYLDDLAAGSTSDFPRERLIGALRDYLAHRDLKADWRSVMSAPPETLVNALAMLCPFGPAEKQALIEARSWNDRVDTLVALLEMSAASAPGNPSLH